MTLTEFLLERIAEDEAVARQVRPHEYLRTRDDSPLVAVESQDDFTVGITSGRVLAECESKRRIVDLYQALDPRAGGVEDAVWVGVGEAVASLAQPYRDHADFDPSWAV